MLIASRNSSENIALPYDKEVEFLQSTGTQWIDTGCPKTTNTTVSGRFFTNASVDAMMLFGTISRINGSTYRYALQINTGSVLRLDAYVGIYTNTSVNYNKNVWHNFSLSSAGDFTYDGAHIQVYGATAFEVEGNIYLFARHNTVNNTADGFASAKVAAFQVFEGDTLLRDLIPVSKDSVGYMYDKITGELLGNMGTGDFVVGPAKEVA